jgi:hypothetical protein
MFIGTVPAKSNDLNSATEEFIKDQLSTNPDFRVIEKPQPINLSGNTALATTVAGPSTVTGVIEIDIIYTVITRDGNLFYLITMTPEDEVDSYKPAFNQITSSIALK